MKEIKHTLESCKESASKYNTRSEWRKNDNSCYQTARNNGWYDECCANMNYMRKKHTLQSCKENAFKYKTKSEWKKNNASVYQTAYKNGWIDECCVNMTSLRGRKIKHTLESCKENASKYKSRSEWIKNDISIYQTARGNGWLEECCVNMIKKYTLDSCKKSASKYKSRNEWKNNDTSFYETARRNGWLDECCVNMPDLRREKKIILTLEDCKKIALKYKSKSEWRKSDYKSLYFAYRNGWLEECCVTMIDYKTKAKHIAIEDILKDDFYKKNYINLSHIIKEFKNFPLGYYTLNLEIY